MPTLFAVALLVAVVATGALPPSPTCGTACVYEPAADFAFNCEGVLFYKGRPYQYSKFQVSCSDTDKACPQGITSCTEYEGEKLCKAPSTDVLLSSYACVTTEGLTIKTGTKETTRSGEFWYFYKFSKVLTPDDQPSTVPVAGFVVLGLIIGVLVGIAGTCAGVWFRNRRAAASFQR
jgi:hypothetical protein